MRAKDSGGWQSTFTALSDEDLGLIIEGLHRITDSFAEWLRPATSSEVLNILADFADFLQVSVPGDAGIELYVQAMDDIPLQLLQLAVPKVARTHKFARLPLPQDFLAQIAGEDAWVKGQTAWVRTMLSAYEKARNLRSNNEWTRT